MFCADLPPRIHASLKVLCCLAASTEALPANTIARRTGLPRAQTPKVLQWMCWAGFLESRRGSKGGFWLAIPPNKIRVSSVIAFFDRPDHKHPATNDCVWTALHKATAACRREFDKVTLADIVKFYKPERARKARTSYAIVGRS